MSPSTFAMADTTRLDELRAALASPNATLDDVVTMLRFLRYAKDGDLTTDYQVPQVATLRTAVAFGVTQGLCDAIADVIERIQARSS